MANSENRICQNCKQSFLIEPEDFDFYKKMDVPAPTFCPDCRAARRMIWRNERTYYKRPCNAPKHSEEIITLHAPETPFTVYDQQYWWSDEWDPLSCGRPYDFNKPFFQQFRELLNRVPFIALSNTNSVNSEYCSSAAWNKDCYLISGSGWNERVLYANRSIKNKDSMDLYIVDNSELCYDDMYCRKCYNVSFSKNCESCNDSAFLYNCRNCQHCFGCSNLRGQNYCIFNRQYSKEEYEEKLSAMNLGSRKGYIVAKERFTRDIYLATVHKYGDLINTINSTGDHLRNTRDCRNCFDFSGDNAEHCRFVNWSGFNTKDLYDTGPGAGWGSELLYEGLDINDSSRVLGGVTVYNSNNISYGIQIHSSSNIFGCYGMRSKKYCILNKEYTEREFNELLPKIKKHMEKQPYVDRGGKKYVYGDFYPQEIAVFAYNETVAQEYFPLDATRAGEAGYTWKESKERSYAITLKSDELPDNITEVSDSILNEVIECLHATSSATLCSEQCTRAFKVTPQELQFYKRQNLPLPRLCSNCRHYGRLAERTPLKIWHRACECAGIKSSKGSYINTKVHLHGGSKCSNEFETSYAPDRPEIIYCEQCYNAEIA